MNIFFPLLAVALAVLKLIGVVAVSWWVVAAVLLAPVLIALVLMLLGFFIVLIVGR